MDKFLGEFDEIWVDDIDHDIIKVGDDVECIYNGSRLGIFPPELTVGNSYRIIDIVVTNRNKIIKVLNDYGYERYYMVGRFKTWISF